MALLLKKGGYFSPVQSFLLGSGLLLTKTVFTSGRKLPGHSHQNPYISIPVKGEYKEEVEGEEHLVTPGVYILHPINEVHKNQIGPKGAVILNLELPSEFWVGKKLEGLKPLVRCQEKNEQILDLARRISALVDDKKQGSRLALEGLSLQILDIILGGQSDGPSQGEVMEEVDHFIRENYLKEVSVQSISKQFEVPSERLARLFRQTYGESIPDRITRLRLQLASRLLLETEKKLAEIAIEVGFFDQAHFSKVFKKKRGISPGKFRRQNRF